MDCNEKFMREALKEARKAYEKDEIPVGAIIVKDGKIISRAYNSRESSKNAIAHAEVLAIKKACKKSLMYSAFVTPYFCLKSKAALLRGYSRP